MTIGGFLTFNVALFVLLPTQPGHVLAQAADVIDDPEAYAVYAAVLPLRFSSGDKAVTNVALLQETRAGSMDCPRDETIQPEWRPVVESYRKENARVRVIEPGRDLGVSYSLVTSAALRKLMQEAGYDLSKFSGQQSPGAEVFARFPGGRLVALSAVGFNVAKTRAMVTVRYDCFPSSKPGSERAFCHEGHQVMMEKEAGRWVPAKVGGCGWGA